MTRLRGALAVCAAAAMTTPLLAASASRPWSDRGNGSIYWGLTACSGFELEPAPLPYYAITLVPTKRVPGTGLATGTAQLAFASSPFGVAVTPEGDYVYDLDLTIDGLGPLASGTFTAWVATAALDRVARLGTLEPVGDRLGTRGRVAWNKFLVVVTLEPPGPAPDRQRWQGPVVLRGMSRSGLMHTLAGHGPFQQEPCLKYGYK